MRSIFCFLILFFALSSAFYGQDEIVKIILEKGNTDVLTIHKQPVNKAYVYGTHEDLIKFLINDRFIQHNIDQGVVYNFILTNTAQSNISKGDFKQQSDKILVLTEDSLSYIKVYNKINPGNKEPEPIFRLARVNNMDVFVSYRFDDSFFSDNEEISKVVLNKEKSDAFLIEGEPMALVSLYGSRENIIHFLINDKFIRHKVSESSQYSFSATKDSALFDHYFQDTADNKTKVLIVIDEDEDFLNLYNMMNNASEEKAKENMSIRIEDSAQMSLIILAPGKDF